MHTIDVPTWVVWVEVSVRLGWTGLAAATALAMRHRGHDGGLWLVVGLVLGPLVVPAAILSARRAAARPATVLVEGAPARGTSGFLVVVPDREPLATVGGLIRGADHGHVVLVAIVGRDTLDHAAREAELRRARRSLLTAVDACAASGLQVSALIAEGRPDTVVPAIAVERNLDVVVVPADDSGRAVARAVRRRCRTVRVQTAEDVLAERSDGGPG